MKVLKLIRINLKEVVIVGLILLFALFLRLYNLDQRTAFNADQEWLAFRARDVIKGDFPLLGPVTSVGSFSIGPGYVYLMAFIGLFTNFTPISGALLSVLLGVLFLLSLFLFIRHFVDSKKDVYTFTLLGFWYDIGDRKIYEELNNFDFE